MNTGRNILAQVWKWQCKGNHRNERQETNWCNRKMTLMQKKSVLQRSCKVGITFSQGLAKHLTMSHVFHRIQSQVPASEVPELVANDSIDLDDVRLLALKDNCKTKVAMDDSSKKRRQGCRCSRDVVAEARYLGVGVLQETPQS